MITGTVIFDFDGTIADTLEELWKFVLRLAPEYGVPHLSRKDFNAARGLTAQQIIKKYNLSWLQLVRIVKHVRDAQREAVHAIPLCKGMDTALKELRKDGYRLGILTNNLEETVRAFLAHHGREEFEFVYAEQGLFDKGRALQKILRVHKIEKENAWYVGDEAKDVEAARHAGIRAVAVTWGFNTSQLLAQGHPDALVRHPRELRAVLKNINQK